jgi:hypothetical protein
MKPAVTPPTTTSKSKTFAKRLIIEFPDLLLGIDSILNVPEQKTKIGFTALKARKSDF